MARQEELRTHAVRVLAESAKRKFDVLEERNAIAAFSPPEAASLSETAQLFPAIRVIYLAQALKRAKFAQAEFGVLDQQSKDDASDLRRPSPVSHRASTQHVSVSLVPELSTTQGAAVLLDEAKRERTCWALPKKAFTGSSWHVAHLIRCLYLREYTH